MTIDRAIEILRDDICGASLWEMAEAVEMGIKALEEQRSHGKWIFKHNSSDIWCSNCDENFDEIPQKFLFCPNCGSDNRPKEGEEK